MKALTEIVGLRLIPKGEPYRGGDYEICEWQPSGVPRFYYCGPYEVNIARSMWSLLEPEDLPLVLLRGNEKIENLRFKAPTAYHYVHSAAKKALEGVAT